MLFRNVTVVRKSYCGQRKILDDVDFTPAGCGVDVIYAPPGSGKTTFLETGAGLIKPDSGSVVRSGKAGFLMQVPERGFTFPSCAQEAGGPLGKAGLPEEIGGLSPWVLSRGERKRLALASVLNYNHIEEESFFLMDDPFTDLDRRGSDIVCGIISGGRFRVVIATNRVSDLALLRERGISFEMHVIEKGKISLSDEG